MQTKREDSVARAAVRDPSLALARRQGYGKFSSSGGPVSDAAVINQLVPTQDECTMERWPMCCSSSADGLPHL